MRRPAQLKTLMVAMVLALMPRVSAAADSAPSRAEYIRSNYAKFEYRIPMRDGVRLFTSVYVPNDRSKRYPMLMFRTPYNVAPYGLDRYKTRLGPNPAFEKEGFIFVFQDVRGRFMSEGEFVNMRPHMAKKTRKQTDESTDTFDTISWLLKNVPGHNGRVGQWGISYPGFYTSAGAIDSHPALKAVSPQAPIADWFWDDMHHHGAFIFPLTFNFFSFFWRRPRRADDQVAGPIRAWDGRRVPVLLGCRAAQERERTVLQGEDRLLEQGGGPSELR